MVPVGQSNDRQLVMRGTGGWVNQCSQVVVTYGWTPIAVLADQFGLAVAREITETDEGRMA